MRAHFCRCCQLCWIVQPLDSNVSSLSVRHDRLLSEVENCVYTAVAQAAVYSTSFEGACVPLPMLMMLSIMLLWWKKCLGCDVSVVKLLTAGVVAKDHM